MSTIVENLRDLFWDKRLGPIFRWLWWPIFGFLWIMTIIFISLGYGQDFDMGGDVVIYVSAAEQAFSGENPYSWDTPFNFRYHPLYNIYTQGTMLTGSPFIVHTIINLIALASAIFVFRNLVIRSSMNSVAYWVVPVVLINSSVLTGTSFGNIVPILFLLNMLSVLELNGSNRRWIIVGLMIPIILTKPFAALGLMVLLVEDLRTWSLKGLAKTVLYTVSFYFLVNLAFILLMPNGAQLTFWYFEFMLGFQAEFATVELFNSFPTYQYDLLSVGRVLSGDPDVGRLIWLVFALVLVINGLVQVWLRRNEEPSIRLSIFFFSLIYLSIQPLAPAFHDLVQLGPAWLYLLWLNPIMPKWARWMRSLLIALFLGWLFTTFVGLFTFGDVIGAEDVSIIHGLFFYNAYFPLLTSVALGFVLILSLSHLWEEKEEDKLD